MNPEFATPEYHAWRQMRHRCNGVWHQDWAHYGGRGIKVSSRWDDYQTFLSDMGRRPIKHSLDRIDVNGNYEPSNCRWTDWKTQERNRRDNKRLTFLEMTKCVSEWAEYFNLPRKKFETHLRKHNDSIPVAIASIEKSYVWKKYTLNGKEYTVKQLSGHLGCTYVALKKYLRFNNYDLSKAVAWYSRKGVAN
jgi:hypothetical protein